MSRQAPTGSEKERAAPAQGRRPGPAPRFVTGSLMRHVVVMSLSGTLGLSFTFMVDFLALWWISRLRDEQLIAAVGIAGTLQFAIMSVAIGMMIAAVAMVSRALGRGEPERARHIASSALLLSFLVESALSAAFWLARRPILLATGASGVVLEQADHFLSVSLVSLPLIALGVTASGLLRAVGDAWRSMSVTMTAGIVAAVLDPLLIIWAGWGITGAALSIVVSRAVMAGAGIWHVALRHHLLARPRLYEARQLARPWFAIALPAIVTQLSPPFGTWILTRAIAAHGDSAIAGMGVVSRLTILAFGGIFALSGAIGGIIGQNWGAGRPDRVEAAFRAALVYCLGYTLLVWAAMAALTAPIAESFGLAAEGAAVLRAFTHVAAGSFVFTGALFVANATFNNLGRPLWSTIANWSRDGLLLGPLAWGIGMVIGAPGVIWGQAVANVVTGTVAALVAIRYIRSLGEDGRAADPTPGDQAP